jgi:DNA-binding MarR family transcriptional regulator
MIPLSITEPSMLIGRSDREFRRLIHRMLITAGRLEAIREAIARQIAVSGTQYTMLMSILHREGEAGISIRALADYLEVTGPHVTSEVGKLAAAGLVRKVVNPNDRRGVLVRLTPEGRQRLLGAFPFIRAVNDRLFGDIVRAEFATLRGFNEKFIKSTQAALDWAATQPVPRRAARKVRTSKLEPQEK